MMDAALDQLLDDPDAIVGASGAGKSYTGRQKVERLLGAGRHTIIFDPTGVWYGLRSDAAGTGPGFDVPIFGGPRADVPIRPANGAAVAGLILDEAISAILDLSQFDEAELRAFALDFLSPLRHRERVNLHLVFDEAEEFAPQTAPDDVGFQLVRQMVWIAKRGRVFGLVPTFITQRPADFAKAVLSQVQTLYFHQLIAPADQAPVRAYLKANSDAATLRTVEASLPELGRGDRWVYSPRRKLLELGRTPAIATFDSMATPAPGEAKREPRTLAQLDVSKIRAALAAADPTDVVPHDPAEALRAGSAVGQALADRDARIAELGTELIRVRTRIDELTLNGVDMIDRVFEAIALFQDRVFKKDEVSAAVAGDTAGEVSKSVSPADPCACSDLAADGDSRAGDEAAVGGKIEPSRPAATPSEAALEALRGRKALAPLAAAYPAWLTEPQWAVIAGFSRKGGTWRTYRSALKAAGLVEDLHGSWRATEAGVQAVGSEPSPMPAAGPDLARFWGQRISGVRKMVEILVRRWPHFTTHDGLAADLGMSATGGTFRTYLGRLRANELLEEQNKRVRLAPAVMQ